ncbi:MAG: ABC transporter permease [Candidatus Limnocylindria bacterium]
MASFVAVVILLVLAWEVAKLAAGTPWREFMGIPLDPPYDPPFRVKQLSDLNLPHVWNVLGALFEPSSRGSPFPLVAVLVDAAIFTWRGAVIGFVFGALFGFVLAVVFVHSRLLERALVPYVIASQTIPIIALAPMIVLWFGRDWLAVALISAYLTFFPVTIGAIRGLSSPDPRALELMRTYAASRWKVLWKVRVPASLPYLFTALKIGATASVVGAIVGEAPTGLAGGLGRTLVTFNQYYLTGPEKLWAAILVTAVLGIVFFSLVRIAELVVLSGQPTAVEG